MPLNNHAQEVLARIEQERKGKRVVFVSGNFNIIHPGHLRLLSFAKDLGDILVIGVLSDSSPSAYIAESLRLEGVRALSIVDHAFLLYDTPSDLILELRPDFVIKGKEHEEAVNPEATALEKTGGQLLFTSGNVSLSANDLALNIASTLRPIIKPTDFMAHHSFNSDTLDTCLDRMHGLRVCVLGDIIVDEYVTCDPLGMSQEDPTIVVTPVCVDRFLGGAGIVAAHVAGLGAEVRLFSVLGHDDVADFARQALHKYDVKPDLQIDITRPTTLKQRFRCFQKTMLRVNHLRQHAISQELIQTFFRRVMSVLDEIDLLVFSDFNYGCLPPQLVNVLTEEARQRNIPVVGDSQSSSQMGDISRFRNTLLLTPTEREARLALHDFESGLVVLASNLIKKTGAKNVVITLGEAGVLIHTADQAETIKTDRLPAMNTTPSDTAGAGDSFYATASLALASGSDIWQASYLGSLAAALQVSRVGNTPLSLAELRSELLNEKYTI
ncbi:PfkB family carbohydrate kinase [Oceanidesulfovibrio marinus]|uniref:ADP-heptose synthase n=1 Tax=Oceanidesulfovibrio marinus TaxID=370038 RepID=A0ABX6ND00_9BACT|nr:PfkB family carbohydrate kinase [Oceanidesulfovibrio marinus]QJT07625.1 ADP-heptose synthase [Oceanidesulfovibrio marinus]